MSAEMKKAHLNNNDRRVKRTKKALREALIKLLNEKSVNQITVTELTELADVNRATFYFYYSDIIDMLQQLQNEVYNAFEEAIINKGCQDLSSGDGLAEYIANILLFLKSDPDIYRFVIENDVNHSLQKKIQAEMVAIIPNSAEKFTPDNPAYFATKFALNGIIGVIIAWLDEGMTADVADVAKFVTDMYLKGSIITLQK